jgi:hypothetical protein
LSLGLNSSSGRLKVFGFRLNKIQAMQVAIKAPMIADPMPIPAASAFERVLMLGKGFGVLVEEGRGLDERLEAVEELLNPLRDKYAVG